MKRNCPFLSQSKLKRQYDRKTSETIPYECSTTVRIDNKQEFGFGNGFLVPLPRLDQDRFRGWGRGFKKLFNSFRNFREFPFLHLGVGRKVSYSRPSLEFSFLSLGFCCVEATTAFPGAVIRAPFSFRMFFTSWFVVGAPP